MQLPTVINDLNIWTVGAAGVILIGGYLTHELMHVIPLELTGTDYSVEFAPGEKPLWWNLTMGRAFEFETEATPLVAIVSLLAPGLLTIPGILMWFHILRADYVSASLGLITATWIIVFLPSLADWQETHLQVKTLRN